MKFLASMMIVLVGWFLLAELLKGNWGVLLFNALAFSLAFLFALLMWWVDKISTRKNK